MSRPGRLRNEAGAANWYHCCCTRLAERGECLAERGRAVEYEGREESQNVEDSRGIGGRGLALGGGGIGAVILIVLALIFGVDPRKLIGPGGPGVVDQQREANPGEEKDRHFS